MLVTSILAFAAVLCALSIAFFAGTESGMLSVSRARLLSLVRQGSRRAASLAQVVADMPRVITTLLVGNNLAGVLASTLSAALAIRLFPGRHLVQTLWGVGAALFLLFCCEYFPKLLFATRPLRRTLLIVPAYRWAELLLAPLVAVFSAFVHVVFHTPPSRVHRLGVSRDGLRTLVADRVNGVRITDVERGLIERVLSLQTRFAVDLMTPLGRADKVRADDSLVDCVALARRTDHHRLPVFDTSGLGIVGVLDVFELLKAHHGAIPAGHAGDAARPPLFIGSRTRADDILPLMRRNRQTLALVREENHDRILGILTEETVLLALTGILKED